MESSLNEAHQQKRRAEAFLKSGKFDEAIECHQKAADLLKDAMTLTQADKALESLQLQYDYHIRQQTIVKFKQKQVEKLRRAIQKEKLQANQDSEETMSPNLELPTENLQYAIYRTMEETDSLLQFLIKNKENGVEAKKDVNNDETVLKDNDEIIRSAVKTPKTDKVVIEELRMNNEELRSLIRQLIFELDKSQQENQYLRDNVSELQMRLMEGNFESSNKTNHLNVITDSSSPFVISPCSELSPIGLRDLPPLPPLEMPKFEFNLLKSNSVDEENI